MQLTDREFLAFAREHLEKDIWSNVLCRWFETATVLMEQYGELCRIVNEISDRPMKEKQVHFRMKNVYKTFS